MNIQKTRRTRPTEVRVFCPGLSAVMGVLVFLGFGLFWGACVPSRCRRACEAGVDDGRLARRERPSGRPVAANYTLGLT